MADGKVCDECLKLIDQASEEEVVSRIEDNGEKYRIKFEVRLADLMLSTITDGSATFKLSDLHQDCIEGLLEGFKEAKLGTPRPTKTVDCDESERGYL